MKNLPLKGEANEVLFLSTILCNNRTNDSTYCRCSNRPVGLHLLVMLALSFCRFFALSGFTVTVIGTLMTMFPFPLLAAFLFISFAFVFFFFMFELAHFLFMTCLLITTLLFDLVLLFLMTAHFPMHILTMFTLAPGRFISCSISWRSQRRPQYTERHHTSQHTTCCLLPFLRHHFYRSHLFQKSFSNKFKS